MDLYTQSFTIPAGGWSGQASALITGTALTTPISLQVTFFRDSTPTFITLRPGEIFPCKVKYVNHNQTAAGTAIVGLN